MSNNKQSSVVDWIEHQINQQGITHFFSRKEILQQAKAMHKEEMMDFAFQVGRGQDYDDEEVRELAKIVYNETFGGNNE